MALVPPVAPCACNFRASSSGHALPALLLCAALHLQSKTVHLPQNNCVCCCLLVSYTFMCLNKNTAISLNHELGNNSTFLRVAVRAGKQAGQTQPSPAGHVQQSLAAPELWAELSTELLPCSEQCSTRFIDFLGCTAKEKWELVAVLFPASLSQSKPLPFLSHHNKLKPWAAFFIFSFLQT